MLVLVVDGRWRRVWPSWSTGVVVCGVAGRGAADDRLRRDGHFLSSRPPFVRCGTGKRTLLRSGACSRRGLGRRAGLPSPPARPA